MRVKERYILGSEILSDSRIFALVCLAVSLFLFGVVAFLFRQEHRIAVNPRVMGRIERTWTIYEPRNGSVRKADFTFTVVKEDKPVTCEAKGLDIGDPSFHVKAGDNIELSPIPGSCERPYVINIQPPTWLWVVLLATSTAAALAFALLACGAWLGRETSQRYGV
jgi:hypothetical protein